MCRKPRLQNGLLYFSCRNGPNTWGCPKRVISDSFDQGIRGLKGGFDGKWRKMVEKRCILAKPLKGSKKRSFLPVHRVLAQTTYGMGIDSFSILTPVPSSIFKRISRSQKPHKTQGKMVEFDLKIGQIWPILGVKMGQIYLNLVYFWTTKVSKFGKITLKLEYTGQMVGNTRLLTKMAEMVISGHFWHLFGPSTGLLPPLNVVFYHQI